MQDTLTLQDSLLKKIESSRDAVIEWQRELTAIPAISPLSDGQGELDKAVYLESELRKLSFDEIKRYDAPDPKAKGGVRPNIVARYKGTKGGAKTLWLMSHLDIVPPGERSMWRTDPYKIHVDGDRIYGRGVEDNQQAVVASLVLAKSMMECGYRPEVDLALLFVADEENGSGYGADYLMEHHKDIFGTRDMFIVPDGGNSKGTMIEVAEKSIWWMRIHTVGKQCHASKPELGRNAFRAASDLAVRLGDLYKKFPKKDPLYNPPISTFEPTKKEPNVPNINTIPGDDVFYLDSRVLPCYPIKKVMAEIRKIGKAVEKKHKVRISFSDVQCGEAAPPTSPDCELVRCVVDAARRIHGAKAKPEGIGGGTVAAFFRRLGLDAVVYSKLDETAHQPNEYCVIPNLIGDAKVFALVAMSAKG
jgi:succinyl-diaminopimelate desuccinylase